ncbi:MAG: hypothetical protein U0R49_05830 [Fimbriimonadales bacterium]
MRIRQMVMEVCGGNRTRTSAARCPWHPAMFGDELLTDKPFASLRACQCHPSGPLWQELRQPIEGQMDMREEETIRGNVLQRLTDAFSVLKPGEGKLPEVERLVDAFHYVTDETNRNALPFLLHAAVTQNPAALPLMFWENVTSLTCPNSADGLYTIDGLRLRDVEKINARRSLNVVRSLSLDQARAVKDWLFYFRSNDELVAAIGEDNLEQMEVGLRWWNKRIAELEASERNAAL